MTELHESGIRAILNLHTAPTVDEFRESNRKAREEILQATRAEGWNDVLCDALKDTLETISTPILKIRLVKATFASRTSTLMTHASRHGYARQWRCINRTEILLG